MASDIAILRDTTYTRILLKKTLSQYLFNDFTVEKTWYPYQLYEDMVTDHPAGKVYIIGLAIDNQAAINRAKTTQNLIPVQIGYQRPEVNHQDLALIDTLVEFVDQLLATIRTEVTVSGMSWLRSEFLKDNNGVPFHFMGIRKRVFEAYFTAYFDIILT